MTSQFGSALLGPRHLIIMPMFRIPLKIWDNKVNLRTCMKMSSNLLEAVLDETGNDFSIRMNLNLLEQTVQSFLWSRSLNKEQKHLDMTLVFGKHILTIIPILPENFNKNFLLGNDFSIWMNLLEQTAQLVLWSRSWNEDFQALVSLNFSCTGHQFWTAKKVVKSPQLHWRLKYLWKRLRRPIATFSSSANWLSSLTVINDNLVILACV